MTDKPFLGRKPSNGVPDIGPFREQDDREPGPVVRRAFRLFGLDEPDYDRCADVARWFRQGTEVGSKVPDWETLADGVDDWWRFVTAAKQAAYDNRNEFVREIDDFVEAVGRAVSDLFQAYGRLAVGFGKALQTEQDDDDDVPA